jgi:hypothetical protein
MKPMQGFNQKMLVEEVSGVDMESAMSVINTLLASGQLVLSVGANQDLHWRLPNDADKK